MYFETIISFTNFTIRKYRFLMLFVLITLTLPIFAINEIKTVGNTGADYSTLKAAFDAVNNGTLSGNVTLRLVASTTETATAILNASGTGAASYNSINIYPTVANLSVSGILSAPLIDLNGADNIVFDGRVNASGSTPSLTISNQSTSNTSGTSTLRFINDASNNAVRYCLIKGSETNQTSGVLFLATTTGVTGNDNNTISNCQITASTDTNRPINIIYSEGSPGSENNNNTISNNNIFDFFSRTSTSFGINISSNSTAFTISNNSFYETTTFIPTASVIYSFIYINNSIGSDFKILNNYIGGSTSQCEGEAWTKTKAANSSFNGIYVAVGTDLTTLIDGNKISNFSWNNISIGNWTGIQANSGKVNIGSTLGNTIGETTGISSIVFNSDNIGPNFYPIQINSEDSIRCENNKIGSISIINARNIVCINKSSDDGYPFINGNVIGSTTTAGSITTTTNSTIPTPQFFAAIYVKGAKNIINSNIISNLISNSTFSGLVRGIDINKGENTVNNNLISKITTASSSAMSLIGVSFSGNNYDNIISGNTISDIKNTNSSNINGTVIGMNLSLTNINTISKNFICNIDVPSNTTNTKIYGIRIENGTGTYSNNIVSLSTAATAIMYGIYESGSQDCNLYHNTVYVGGSPSSGVLNSYALYSASNSNTINYKNNIFENSRSNSGANGKNYAAYFNYSTAGSLTLNYNVYFTNGTGGVLGHSDTDKYNIPLITGQDANSLRTTPGFLNVGGTTATDYKPVVSKFDGTIGTLIIDDFGGAIRASIPTIGAWEFAGGNMWKGSVDTDWGNASNWTLSTIPASGDNIIFDPYPINHLVLDVNRTVNNITINQSTYRIVLNGKRLTLQGALIFTNGAQIDAAATNSRLIFAGTTQQYLNSTWLLNTEIYDIDLGYSIIYPVILSGNLVLLGNISSSGGRLDASTNSPTITYRGSLAQQVNNNVYSLGKVHNLTIDNTVGLTINASLTISNTLTINTGKLLTLSASTKLQVNDSIINNAGAAGFVLNSTTTGTCSLINNTNNVPATARRYIGGTSTAWHFLSSPISSQPLSGDWKPTGTYSDGTGYDLYVWDEPANCWVYNLNNSVAPTWNSVHPSADFIAGKGYLYALQATNQTKQFAGLLNNGNIPISINNSSTKSHKGFNFLGNPYPSSIDWTINAGFTRDMLELTGGGFNIWIWSNTANNYGVYNSADTDGTGTNGSTRYISPNMGFFVKASNAGTFVFKNAARLSNEARNWTRVKTNQKTLPSLSVKVNSTDSLGSDEVQFNFNLDINESGAPKLYSNVKTAPSLFIQSNDEDFTTYYLTNTSENPSIEVGFKAGKDGKYSLSANEFKNDFEVILLEDKQTGKVTDLKSTDNYIFTSKTTDNPSRFNIHFSKTALDDLVLGFAKVFATNKNININLKEAKGTFTVKILDVNGIIFDEFTAVGGEQRIVPNPINGVVFVKLYNNEKSKTFKLLN